MSSDQTIELGIRLYESDDIDAIEEKIRLAAQFKCYHFQIASTVVSMHHEVSRLIMKYLDNRFETSVYVPLSPFPGMEQLASPDVSTGFQRVWQGIVDDASQAGVKFIVVNPDWILKYSESPKGVASVGDDINMWNSTLGMMLKEADRNREFLCLENQAAQSSFCSPNALKRISGAFNSWWLKLSLNVNNMIACGFDLSAFTSALFNQVAIVTYSNNDGSNRSTDQMTLDSVLSRLFRLPYQQRPFILTDRKIVDLHIALQNFRRVVLERGLYYV